MKSLAEYTEGHEELTRDQRDRIRHHDVGLRVFEIGLRHAVLKPELQLGFEEDLVLELEQEDRAHARLERGGNGTLTVRRLI